mmetsp:Transcript_8684/g.32019  ORF Transcript_8684/g.32019 Transcript_8684/m.32019 type:complete len:554 (-) Transcript_8684:2458-4119(-)
MPTRRRCRAARTTLRCWHFVLAAGIGVLLLVLYSLSTTPGTAARRAGSILVASSGTKRRDSLLVKSSAAATVFSTSQNLLIPLHDTGRRQGSARHPSPAYLDGDSGMRLSTLGRMGLKDALQTDKSLVLVHATSTGDLSGGDSGPLAQKSDRAIVDSPFPPFFCGGNPTEFDRLYATSTALHIQSASEYARDICGASKSTADKAVCQYFGYYFDGSRKVYSNHLNGDEAPHDPSSGRSKPCLPQFIVGGLPKCGTSSLFNLLTHHPQIANTRKEPDFFVTNSDIAVKPFFGWVNNDTVRVKSYFAQLLAQTGRHTRNGLLASADREFLTIDAQPRTLQGGSKTAAALYTLCPSAKVVVLVCQPSARAVTHFSYRYYGHGLFGWQRQKLLKLNATFATVVERQLREMHPAMWKPNNFREFGTEPELDIDDSVGINTFVRLGLYGYALAPWYRYFQQEQIKVVTQDDLKDNPLGLMRSLESFLGIQEIEYPSRVLQTKRNTNIDKVPVSNETWSLLQDFYRPHNVWLEDISGIPGLAGKWDRYTVNNRGSGKGRI